MAITRRRAALLGAALLTVAALLAAGVVLWRDPYNMVRADYLRARLSAGLRGGTVQAAGHRWAYAYSNKAPENAPVIVMLHGYTGSKENWYPLAQRLRGQYRMIIPDLPGWGDSQRIAGADYGYLAQAERVSQFIAALSPDRPVVLLGHSMGGGIAAVLAAEHPEQIARVGLFAASGVRFKDNQFGIDVLAGKNPFGVRDSASMQRYLKTVFHDPQAQPWIPWPASDIFIARRRSDSAFEQSVLDRIGRSKQRFAPGEAAAAIDQPALLLWCQQDQVIDASAMTLYGERMPQAMQVLLDGCGHMSLTEQPDLAAAAVQALIERGQPRELEPISESLHEPRLWPKPDASKARDAGRNQRYEPRSALPRAPVLAQTRTGRGFAGEFGASSLHQDGQSWHQPLPWPSPAIPASRP